MTTMICEKELRVCVRQTRGVAKDAVCAEALERLLTLLEGEGVEDVREARSVRRCVRGSQTARLHKAHARYALATTDELVRVGDGAWLRRRYN